jgi:Xaa-Pro aminopeptidase
MSGFTGTAGVLVVTQQSAGLWTDSRYWEQAHIELACSEIIIMRQGQPDVPEVGDWLIDKLPKADVKQSRALRVGLEGAVWSITAARRLADKLDTAGIAVVDDVDLLAAIWQDRPPLPMAPVQAHDPAFAPVPRAAKLAQVRVAMRRHGATIHVLSTLDDIAWLTNLRGSDGGYNPVFLAYALVWHDRATLYVQPGCVDGALIQSLQSDGIAVADYAAFTAELAALTSTERVLLDPARNTLQVSRALPSVVGCVEDFNPSTLAKACKTPAELAHVRAAMTADGVALCEFLAWFDANQGQPMTELTIDEVLTAKRRAQPGYVSLSFPTIAGFNANGALPHYRATPEAHSLIEGDGLLLIDSGAQYVGGTTDITRVVPVGQPCDKQKLDFTLVLKGMIALSRLRYPVEVAAPLLDAVARAPIWHAGIDYGHGTGHGVGYFLNVHEGPQVIAYRSAPAASTAMKAGMITSNEPGIYRPQQWGVRIENLLVNVPADVCRPAGLPRTAAECAAPLGGGQLAREDADIDFGQFLEFETLTLCPIDSRCMLVPMLNQDERQWLDAYHAVVFERLAPWLDASSRQWLATRCAPLNP